MHLARFPRVRLAHLPTPLEPLPRLRHYLVDQRVWSKQDEEALLSDVQARVADAAARYLAKTQKEADLIGGVKFNVKDKYLAHTLFDLTQTATIADSLKLGKYMLGQLGEINRLHRNEVEQAGFAVLKAPDIPSVLVETAFISNPAEEAKLTNTNHQDKIADAMMDGIPQYFAKNPALARV